MNERDENLAVALAEITSENQKLQAAHSSIVNELNEIKVAMRGLSLTLTNRSDEMVDLSYRSLGASLKLLGLLRVFNDASAIAPPSIEEIDAAKSAVIEACESVTNAANMVSYGAHDVYAFMHASRTPNT